MSRLLPSHLHRAGPATPGKPEFRLSVLSWNLSGVTASALEASRTDLVLFREFVGRIVCLARPGPTVDSSDVVQFGFQEILLLDSKRGSFKARVIAEFKATGMALSEKGMLIRAGVRRGG